MAISSISNEIVSWCGPMAILSGTVSLLIPSLAILCPVAVVNSYAIFFFCILIKALLIKDDETKFLIALVSNKA